MMRLVIVSGQARCGTSLVMQMLEACGLRCAGEYPSFESPESNHMARALDPAWLAQFEAVKILDPHRSEFAPWPDGTHVVWMDRDPHQQARSAVKMVTMFSGRRFPESAVAKIAASFVADRPEALSRYAGLPIFIGRFEDAILNTDTFCNALCTFLDLDPASIDGVVVPRKNGAECEPRMDIEAALIGAR